jgi:hypothetical protein
MNHSLNLIKFLKNGSSKKKLVCDTKNVDVTSIYNLYVKHFSVLWTFKEITRENNFSFCVVVLHEH